jgi:hypothetical protein
MDTFPSKELLNYGIAVPLMAFILWAGRAIVLSMLRHIDAFFKGLMEQQKENTLQQKENTLAMKEMVKAVTATSERCLACRVDSVSTIRDSERRIVEKFTEIAASVHDRTFTEIEKGFLVLGKTFNDALTGTALSIRKGQDELVMKVENERLQKRERELEKENDELSQSHVVTDGAVPRRVR